MSLRLDATLGVGMSERLCGRFSDMLCTDLEKVTYVPRLLNPAV